MHFQATRTGAWWILTSTRGPLRVTHFGVTGDRPGGMAQVVRSYMGWTYERSTVRAIASTNGRGDPLSGLRMLRCLIALFPMWFRGRDVAHVHLSQGGAFVREGAIVALSHFLRIPAVAHLHGSRFARFTAAHPRLVRWVLRRADAIIVLTSEAAATIHRVDPTLDARVTQLANAVWIPPLPVTKAHEVVFAGEVGHRKGADLLIEAWTQIHVADWELVIAGPLTADGPVLDGVPGVRVLGAVPHEQVLTLLETSSIAVLPSRHEALPMFLLEAMARSNAVISTTVGDIPRLLEGQAGVVLDSPTPNDVAAALISLMEDEERRSELQRNARSRVEGRHNATSLAIELDELWVTLADGRHRR